VSELPTGWVASTVGAIAEVQLGKMLDKLKNKGEPTTYLRNINVRWGSFDLADLAQMRMTPDERGAFGIRDGDVLVCEGGEPGRAAVWRGGPTTITYQKALMRLRSAGVMEPDLLQAFLRHLAGSGALSDHFTGTTIKHLPQNVLRQVKLPIPPAAEQRRIVAKLDALTARTARARADLDRIPALAARFKQAVLAKAFNGELTAEWRAGKPNLMSAQAIRAAILKSWEASQAPTSRRRGPIADPEAGRQPVELGPLPDTWVQMDLASVTDPGRLIQYGILKPGDHIDGGVPYVKVMNIKGGVIELGKIRSTTPEIHQAYRRSSLREGDLLLTIRGTVGRLAEVPAELDGGNITQDSVRIAVLPGVSRRFIYWFLHSPAAQGYFRANQKGVAVRGINVGDVRPMELPVCSFEEQEEIVRRVDHAMVEIDRLAAEAAAGRRLLGRLDQAVLAKAFRGELVAQDPVDEPASTLLDRIRAERASVPKAGRGRRKAVA
jgi:type I restriction enzyme S subunit